MSPKHDLKLKGCFTNQWSIEFAPWVSSSFVCDWRWRCDVNSLNWGPWLSLGAVLVAAADIGSHREPAGERITELVTLSGPQQQVPSAGDRKKYVENPGLRRTLGVDWFCHAWANTALWVRCFLGGDQLVIQSETFLLSNLCSPRI